MFSCYQLVPFVVVKPSIDTGNSIFKKIKLFCVKTNFLTDDKFLDKLGK